MHQIELVYNADSNCADVVVRNTVSKHCLKLTTLSVTSAIGISLAFAVLALALKD